MTRLRCRLGLRKDFRRSHRRAQPQTFCHKILVRAYHYIGNPDFIPKGEFPPRTLVDSVESVRTWMSEHSREVDIEGNIAATYVVDTNLQFWIADRGSEHVACARLGDVISAGEVFFSESKAGPYIDHITNQSTGYCPEPSSWPAITKALLDSDLEFPHCFDPEFTFRRCTNCEDLSVVKEGFFVCLACNTDLPADYNVQ